MTSELFRISQERLEEVNRFLLDPANPEVQALLRVVAKYGTPEEINAKARAARCLSSLMGRLERMGSPYLENLRWLESERDKGAFIPISEYRKKVLGGEPAGRTIATPSESWRTCRASAPTWRRPCGGC